MTSPIMERPQLLSVDDELNILKSLKRTLRRCDVDVTVANSGAEALEIMATRQFDVILSDMRMPEMTGAEFLAIAYKQQPDCKRILLTGYSDMQSTIDAINNGGVTTYLAKPWDDDQLIRVIEDAVRVKRLTTENAGLQEVTRAQNEELKTLNAGLETKVKERTEEIERASSLLHQAVEDLTDSYDTMVSLLSATAALRDSLGRNFSEEIVELGLAMADLLSLSPQESKAIDQAIQLHRIGLLCLPDDILHKPYQGLTADQKQSFDQHPVYAEATLMGVKELNDAALIIRHQNERWDGLGLPDSKLRSAIPIGSRILKLVKDYFDLMAGRYEQQQLSSQEAIDFLCKHEGQFYDPELIPIFKQALGKCRTDSHDLSELNLDVTRLLPGMTLARDLKSDEGMMLLRKDQQLTDALIRKIANLVRSADSSFKITVKSE